MLLRGKGIRVPIDQITERERIVTPMATDSYLVTVENKVYQLIESRNDWFHTATKFSKGAFGRIE
jgi:hypothetical protein